MTDDKKTTTKNNMTDDVQNSIFRKPCKVYEGKFLFFDYEKFELIIFNLKSGLFSLFENNKDKGKGISLNELIIEQFTPCAAHDEWKYV